MVLDFASWTDKTSMSFVYGITVPNKLPRICKQKFVYSLPQKKNQPPVTLMLAYYLVMRTRKALGKIAIFFSFCCFCCCLFISSLVDFNQCRKFHFSSIWGISMHKNILSFVVSVVKGRVFVLITRWCCNFKLVIRNLKPCFSIFIKYLYFSWNLETLPEDWKRVQ